MAFICRKAFRHKRANKGTPFVSSSAAFESFKSQSLITLLFTFSFLLLPSSGMSWPLVLVDDVGRSVTLTAQARRMVSLAPSNTDILFTLGLGKSIVGAT